MHTRGGLFYPGGCHATQGDGELFGVAIEQCATVSLEVDAIKDWSCARPGLGRENFLVPLGRWKMRRASPIANRCAGRAPATASMRSTLTCFSVKQDASGSETWSIRKLPWVRRSQENIWLHDASTTTRRST
ncbi:MAG TPA: acetamidase/formamidase family protein, partial [Bradyrhizobium sp.]